MSDMLCGCELFLYECIEKHCQAQDGRRNCFIRRKMSDLAEKLKSGGEGPSALSGSISLPTCSKGLPKCSLWREAWARVSVTKILGQQDHEREKDNCVSIFQSV